MSSPAPPTGGEGRLTLVVTRDGATVPCLWSLLNYPTGDAARNGLQAREGCNLRDVGIWPGPAQGAWIGADAIVGWSGQRRIDHVVWAALPSKFDHRDGVSPPLARAAIDYLASREPAVLKNAELEAKRIVPAKYQVDLDAPGWRGLVPTARRRPWGALKRRRRSAA